VLLETGAGCAYAAQRQTGAAGGESVRYAVFSRALLENRPYIALSSVLHRRDAVGGDAPFDERADAAADWLLLLRLTERCAARAVPCVLGHRQRAPTPTADAAAVDAWLAHERIAKVLDDAAVPGVERMFAPRFRPQPRQPRPVSIVIPSYECLDHLRLCLAALRRFTATPCEVIVVDNASSPPVQALLAQIESADTIIIRNRANAGFTRAVNQGIERAAPGHDIVLLNNDAVVTPGWLGALQRALEDLPDAGIVVPRQVLLPGTDTVAVHQPACDPQREIDVNLSAHHDNIVDAGLEPATGLIELSFAPFFCAYLPRGVVDALGPLDDEGAPHYRSDRLYCEAVRRLLGRRIVYTPHAKVYHFLQRATRALETRSPAEYQAYFVRNQRPAAEAP
jgi:O-antigen biosynthesis protein